MTSLVPLELRIDRFVAWRNPTPSSPRFCRPLRIAFAKETTELTRQEIARVEAEIAQLQPLQTDAATVHFQLAMTMVSAICNDTIRLCYQAVIFTIFHFIAL